MRKVGLLDRALAKLDIGDSFKVTTPDGRSRTFGSGEPVFEVEFRTAHALAETLAKASLGFGDAYARGDINVRGDLQALIRVGFEARRRKALGSTLGRLQYVNGYLGRRNTPVNSRENIAAHYDLSNDFYALWLGQQMQYTCAYFDNPADSLDLAQARKLERVASKLCLEPGMVVVEAGGGWGGLGLHLARNHGVTVRSFNISAEQLAWSRARAAEAGIGEDRLQYIEADYRTIPEHVPKCDRFVSICMLEHVGRENYPKLFDIIAQTLAPKGLALLQFISRTKPSGTPNPWLEARVFPGYYNPSIGEVLKIVESASDPLLVLDVENMRYHYALTLERWLGGLERNGAQIAERWGDGLLRTFRLYLAGGIADFAEGRGSLVYQMLLGAGPDNAAPLHRARRLSETCGLLTNDHQDNDLGDNAQHSDPLGDSAA